MENGVQTVLVVDCADSTVSAVLLESSHGEWSLVARAEIPIEREDRSKDVLDAIARAYREIETVTGRKLRPAQDADETNRLLVTSSAGGGLQMVVAGLVRVMTAESAERAALGAGAMVMDVLAIDDGRPNFKKIQRLRELKPDMILISGGVDGGNVDYVLELAECVRAAKLDAGLPVIFAGNVDARAAVGEVLKDGARLFFADNVRPVLEREVLEPAAREIHHRFMDHLVSRVPGYDQLADWTPSLILPTNAATGHIIEALARTEHGATLAVQVGEAISDVFSYFDARFTRTSSGDLGVGSSLSNVVAEAGVAGILRWLPFPLEEKELRNFMRNKSLHPYNRPADDTEILIEQAVCREIIRLAIMQHQGSVVGLRGVRRERDVSDMFDQTSSGDSLYDASALRLVIAAGTPFRFAANPGQVVSILLDAVQPLGVVGLAVDRYGLAPHFGALMTVDAEAALNSYARDGLVFLATALRPWGNIRAAQPCLVVRVLDGQGKEHMHSFVGGEIRKWDLPQGRYAAQIEPAANIDIGWGKGKRAHCELRVEECGLVVDARIAGQINAVEPSPNRSAMMSCWLEALQAKPMAKGGWSR